MAEIIYAEDILGDHVRRGTEGLADWRDTTLRLGIHVEEAKIGAPTALIEFDPPEGGGPVCLQVPIYQLNEAVERINEQYKKLAPPGMA